MRLAALLTILLVLVVACSDESKITAPHVEGMTGTWEGTVAVVGGAAMFDSIGTCVMTLTQSGDAISGTAIIKGIENTLSSNIESFPLTGTVYVDSTSNADLMVSMTSHVQVSIPSFGGTLTERVWLDIEGEYVADVVLGLLMSYRCNSSMNDPNIWETNNFFLGLTKR